jgi:PAS domain S-box-containing protein
MKKKVLLLLFSLGFNFTIHANPISVDYADSLLNLIANTSSSHQKVGIYLKLIKYYQKADIDKSIELCDSAISIGQNNLLPLDIIEVKLEKIHGLNVKGNTDEAIQNLFDIEVPLSKLNNQLLWGRFFLEKNAAFVTKRDYANAMDNALRAKTFFEKCNDTLSIAKTYKDIGSIYDLTGNRRKALENFLISQDYALAIGANLLLNDLYNNMGVVYDELDNNSQALLYYFKALETSNKMLDEPGTSSTFNNIASVLHELKRDQEALVYFSKAMAIDTKNKNFPGLVVLYFNLGEFYFSKENMDSAKLYFQKEILLSQIINDQYSEMAGQFSLGKLFLKQNSISDALAKFQLVFDTSNKSGFEELRESAAIHLSETFKKLGDYQKAYRFQNAAYQIADSARKINKVNELAHSELQLEFKNQSRKYEKDIESYELTKLLEEKKLARERYFFYLVITLVFLVAALIYRSLKNSSKTNKILVQQNKEIEEQKQLFEISNIEIKEQYTFTETLLNTIPNPVFYTDKNSVILGGNIAFEEISGRSMDEMVGISLTDLNIKTFLSCDTAKLFSNPGKDLLRNEGTMVFKDKKEHDVICYRKGILNNEERLIGTLGIIIDISDIRKAERNLKFSQNKLKEALTAKDKFFNIMAHDLKNPFNAILGLTSIMSDNYDDHSADEIKQFVKLVNQSANQVYNLLENLLEWARAQSGTIEKSPSTFPINDVIHESLNLFNQSLEQKKLQIVFDESRDYLVYADKNMIHTVFRNLFSNAIKYSLNEGKIEIRLIEENNFISIEIVDYGMGIKPEHIDKIFKIDQPHSTPGSNNEKGTGLGLIISQEFVKQNGGKIVAQSEYGKGSTFKFSLPRI